MSNVTHLQLNLIQRVAGMKVDYDTEAGQQHLRRWLIAMFEDSYQVERVAALSDAERQAIPQIETLARARWGEGRLTYNDYVKVWVWNEWTLGRDLVLALSTLQSDNE